MALRYGLLTRGNVALNDTFGCDFQAGAEAMLNFIGALSQRISYLPGCGLLASFAGASRAKLLLDAELAAYARRLARPWSAGEEDLAVDLIARVGPRGSFLGQPHTVTHCRSALYHPPLFCRSSYERWREGESLVRRAEERAERLLEQYTAPPLAPAAERLLARALAP
jgi:trimethylamine--corrinoid protein Co-methyltransferase